MIKYSLDINLPNEQNIEIGDKVVITRRGSCYSSWNELARAMKLTNFVSGAGLSNFTKCVVLNMIIHPETKNIILGVEDLENKDRGNQTLIGIEGVKLIEKAYSTITPLPSTKETKSDLFFDIKNLF